MARPRKIQEPAPKIVNDEDTLSISLSDDDDEPSFDEAEESFNEKDLEEITAIAEKIVAQTRDDVPSGRVTSSTSSSVDVTESLERLTNSVKDLTDKVDKFVTDDELSYYFTTAADELYAKISEKLDKILLRDDPSKILYVLNSLVEEKFAEVLDRLNNTSVSSPTVNKSPSYIATAGTEVIEETFPKETVDKIRKWLSTIPSGKTASFDTVVSEIDKRIGLGHDCVSKIIVNQTDMVKISNGRIHSL